MKPRTRLAIRWSALGLILAVCTSGIYVFVRHLSEAGPEFAANRGLTLLLSSAIVVLVLGLAGVLIRNLVRLIMDRKRGILGSRLRTKLVFFFLVLVLPPALVLFYGSATIIKMTVDAVLKTPVEGVTRDAQAIVGDWTDYLQSRCLWEAERIAETIGHQGYLLPDRRPALETFLESWREREELQLVLATRGLETVARASDPRLPEQLGGHRAIDVASEAVAEVLEDGKVSTRLDYLGHGLLAHAAAPVRETAEEPAARPAGVVVVGIYLPRGLAARLERISTATEAYRQFRAQRSEMVALYLSLIALIFLVTVFGATWMGFYLSKRITGPVHELAAATREIAAGNLGVRVGSEVGDEIGVLVEAFNEMAAQLQESQAVITRSTAELRRSNRELDERRRYIETLLANLSTGVLSLDEDGRVTTANPAAETILGAKIRPGDAVRDLLATPGLEPLRELLDEVATHGGEEIRRHLTLLRRGEGLSVSVQVSRLRGVAGKELGILVMVEDLSDLLRAQRAAAWREVARRIAHEIKNPLTPIQLAAQRLRKKFQEKAPDVESVAVDATASIEKEVSTLKSLVDEFSRFARMPELSPELVDFGHVVDSAVALYRGQPGVHWELDADPAVGKVRVDPEQMRRVLINLIDNALSAMGGEGTIRITTRAHGGPGSVRIEVADSGPGIPPRDRDKMFVPYFSTKRRGTGLGLAIVHRVVTDHHGTIRVEDNQPRGARFVIEIPG